jgi:hypothetical protein
LLACALAPTALAQALARQSEFDAKKSALYAQRAAARQLKESAPQAYLRSYVEYLEAQERLVKAYPELPHAAVGLRGEVGNDYLNLGHFARFKLKRAGEALKLYEAGARNGLPLAAFAVADTYQFDLRDKAQALARYRALLEGQRGKALPSNEIEAAIARFASAWLRHQVDYLASGRTFSGAIPQDECSGLALILYYGAGGGAQDDYFDLGMVRLTPPLDRKAIGQKLAALPASGFTLIRTAALASAMPDADSILRYLGKHDPAGFASACVLGMVDLIDREAARSAGRGGMLFPGLAAEPRGAANPMRIAAARFGKERGIVAAKPDPRMASPEQTWQLLIASLKQGDAETALSCLTPGLQNRFRPLFSQPPEKLRAMAESFTGFAISTKIDERTQEAIATRGQHAGMVYFVDVGGAWKISEM